MSVDCGRGVGTFAMGVVMQRGMAWLAVLGAVLATSGCDCGGGNGTGPDGGTELPAVYVFCMARAQRTCEYQERCGYLAPEQESLCASLARAPCEELAREVTAGARTYDEAAGQACLASLEAAPCTQDSAPFALACDSVTTASASLGMLCAPGLCQQSYCRGNPFTDQQCPVCTPYATGMCAPWIDDCGPNHRCLSPTHWAMYTCMELQPQGAQCFDGRQCLSNTCYPSTSPTPAPSRCGPRALSEACGSVQDCAADAYCQGLRTHGSAGQVQGVCAQRLALGQPCVNEQWDDGCADGGSCLEGRCVAVAPYSRSAGQECDAWNQCAPGQYCPHAGFPTLPDGGYNLRDSSCSPRLGTGAACRGGLIECAPGFFCSPAKVCEPYRTAGQPCDSASQPNAGCQGYLTCPSVDGGTPVCTPLRAENESCTSDELCQTGACVLGTCLPPQPTDALCDTPADCATQRCTSTADPSEQRCADSCF